LGAFMFYRSKHTHTHNIDRNTVYNFAAVHQWVRIFFIFNLFSNR